MIAILGDLHFGVRNDSEHFLEYQKRFFDFFFDYLEDNHIDTIIQVGDFFDKRKTINFNTLHFVKKNILDRMKNYKVIVISGNHDCYFKSTNSVNSVRILLGEEYGFRIIDETPESVILDGMDVDFYPWISSDNYSACIEYPSQSDAKIAVGHFEFANFDLHKGQLAMHGMDHKIFSRYDRVISGHYHTSSQKDNVLYTGVPYEMDWADCGDPKGFWLLDKGECSFVRNPETMYSKIFYEDDMEVPDNLDGKIVKLIVASKSNQKKFDSFVNQVNNRKVHDLKIIDSSIQAAISEVEEEAVEGENTIDLVNRYIDSLEIQISKDRLKTKMNSLYNEAKESLNA